MDTSNLEFLKAVKSLFLRQEEGNLASYIYNTPNPSIKDDPVRGEEYYQKFVYEDPNYYLYQDEVSLIQKVADRLAAHVPPQATIIELGPGTEKAFVGKTIPFLKAVPQIHQYVPVDLCDKYLLNARKLMKKELPEVRVKTLYQDFFKEINWVKDYTLPVIFFKGSTIANLQPQQCIDFLQAVSEVLGYDGKLIVEIDANQNKESLALAYNNQAVSNIVLSVFHLINRDLPVQGFDPSAFIYKFEWIPSQYCVQHKAIATEAQNFELDATPIKLSKGEEFHLLSSHKYPVEVFQSMAKQAGLAALDYFINDSQRMAVHVLTSQA